MNNEVMHNVKKRQKNDFVLQLLIHICFTADIVLRCTACFEIDTGSKLLSNTILLSNVTALELIVNMTGNT